MVLVIFKSVIFLLWPCVPRASDHYLQVEVSSSSIFQISATNIFSSSTGIFIEGLRRWERIKDLPGHLIQTEGFSAFEGLDEEVYKCSVCINCFTLKIKLGGSFC